MSYHSKTNYSKHSNPLIFYFNTLIFIAILVSGRWHKKLNLPTEFSDSIFIKFCFKIYWY